MDREERKHLKEKYKDAFQATRQIINDIDPKGLVDWCGPEEYDMEVTDILAKLKKYETEEEIKKMVVDVFTHWFDDPGDLDLYDGVGQKLIKVKDLLN
jgi:hypothetical protein